MESISRHAEHHLEKKLASANFHLHLRVRYAFGQKLIEECTSIIQLIQKIEGPRFIFTYEFWNYTIIMKIKNITFFRKLGLSTKVFGKFLYATCTGHLSLYFGCCLIVENKVHHICCSGGVGKDTSIPIYWNALSHTVIEDTVVLILEEISRECFEYWLTNNKV